MRKCQDWARTHSNLCANFTCFCQNKVWKNILAPWLDRLATWRDISGFPAAARKSWCVEQLFSFLPRLEAWDAIVQCIEAHQIYAQQLKFLQWVRKTKKSSNLSLLIADSVPKTGGEKRTARQAHLQKNRVTNRNYLSQIHHHTHSATIPLCME